METFVRTISTNARLEIKLEKDMERRERYRRNGQCDFMLFVDHHRDITTRYERSRWMRPTYR
ncbi:hypothetical protein Scep_012489 [Stephania cephalantha]|uniref:Uncharacterized protein n=1 Tax=Stephania cephalantha TaxID=152367 RepID=A0AAP0JGL2_9MAGN